MNLKHVFLYFLFCFVVIWSGCKNSQESGIPEICLIDSADFDFQSIQADSFTIDTVFIRNDCIYLNVYYRGGCKDHGFDLYCTGPFIKTNPPGCDVFLSHDSNEDSCDINMSQSLEYDLTPLDKYDEDKLILYIHSYDDQILRTLMYEK